MSIRSEFRMFKGYHVKSFDTPNGPAMRWYAYGGTLNCGEHLYPAGWTFEEACEFTFEAAADTRSKRLREVP
jgi:hypothetical protein